MKTSRTVVGVDTAKRVFQLYWVDMETGEIMGLKLTWAKFLEHFANRAPCLIGMEACGGSQHWARRLRELGHEVRLLPAKMVRPFVGGNKSDAHDARAIWTAVQQPGNRLFLVFRRNSPPRLLCHLVPPGRYLIYRLVRDPGAMSVEGCPQIPDQVVLHLWGLSEVSAPRGPLQ